MKVKFYGVRGSYPVPGEETNVYGGNTTCVTFAKQVDDKTVRIIIDMGTGAIDLGNEIISNYLKGEEDLNLITLFTHLHPDHTQAFPFFAPNYFAECNIQLLGMETLKKNVGTVLKQEMLPPTFPIEYSDLKSNRKHFVLKDGQSIYIDKDKNVYYDHQSKLLEKNQHKLVFEVKVMQSFAPSHPQQGALYYTVKDLETNKKAACIWDIESHPGGDRRVINFSRECDLMIHDTQFTHEEYSDHKMIVQGFGHSTYEMAIENAVLSGIKEKLICMHYNPSHSDDKLSAIEENFLAEQNKNLDFTVLMAKEGFEVEL
jgi:ribonuclease BN (tRNA processing enzyme)